MHIIYIYYRLRSSKTREIGVIYVFNTHVVNDVFLRVRFVRSWRVHGTHDVHLVVLEWLIVFVHVDYVVCVVYPESETIENNEISYTFIVIIIQVIRISTFPRVLRKRRVRAASGIRYSIIIVRYTRTRRECNNHA